MEKMKRPLLSPIHEGDDFSIKSQVGFHFQMVPGQEKEGGDSCEDLGKKKQNRH